MTEHTIRALLADQTAMQQDPRAQKIMLFAYLAFFGVIMWFMMIAPQRKKAKQQDLMLKGLRPGDKIVTSSGIMGVILTIKDKSVSLRSSDTKLEILKSAIAEITERSGETSEIKS